MFDVIDSIVISLSRCCLPNDEGPAPQFFPRTAPAYLYGSSKKTDASSVNNRLTDALLCVEVLVFRVLVDDNRFY